VPVMNISSGNIEKAKALRHEAHEMCFVARSVNFAVEVSAEIS
jgi:organic hydroperoxide reductase OsmC/OhrA